MTYNGKNYSVPRRPINISGFKTKPEEDNKDYTRIVNYKKVTEDNNIFILLAFRCNTQFFESNSEHQPHSGSACQSDYETLFFAEPNSAYQSAIKLNRNGHELAPLPQPKVDRNARADAKSRCECLTQAGLYIQSRSDDGENSKFMNDAISLSLRKGAERQVSSIDTQLRFLVEFARKNYAGRIFDKLTSIAEANRQENAPEEESEEESEEETEESEKEASEAEESEEEESEEETVVPTPAVVLTPEDIQQEIRTHIEKYSRDKGYSIEGEIHLKKL